MATKTQIEQDRLSLTFAALADPTRRSILSCLGRGEACVTDLAAPFDTTLPAITKHLKVLERAGLISRRRDAQRRPCRLEVAAFTEAAGWIAALRSCRESDHGSFNGAVRALEKERSRG